jgi:transposase
MAKAKRNRTEKPAGVVPGAGEFFDPHDTAQVKYEMLRRVAHDGHSVGEVVREFGFTSRQSFYTAQAAFEEKGLAGLMPSKPGPRQAYKITAEVLDFITEERRNEPWINLAELTKRIRKRFHLDIHEKSVERALARINSTYPLLRTQKV